MDSENDMYRHFILNQRETILPQRKIYTPLYFCLMLTMIIIAGTSYKYNQLFFEHFKFLEYILSILAILIAFVIISFSQFIGHRVLYILSYISYAALVLIIHFLKEYPSELLILYQVMRNMLFSQIIIQIYGMWPQKFARIFIELFLFYYSNKFKIYQFKLCQDLSYWILIVIILVNFIWLVCGYFKPIFTSIKDFKSPETDNVLKDFGRLLCNIKILVFTVLLISAQLSTHILAFSWNFIQQKLIAKQYPMYIFDAVLPILAIILLLFLVNLKKKPSFMILFSFIPLVIGLLIILFSQLLKNADNMDSDKLLLASFLFYFFYIVIFYALVTFKTPQYCQILLNIGIKNIDFVSSIQQLAFGQSYILYLYLANQQENFILSNLWIIIVLLIASIIILSVVFYQFLGFKRYMRNTNISQVEEDNLQIEIV